MAAKTCIALALTVLFGALAVGNPCLRPRGGVVAPPANVHLISLRSGVVAPEHRLPPPCPEPALQALVTEVRFDAAGEPSWILRDGRVLRRDAVTAATAAAGH
ncbi:MAG: hypothetical protein JNM25_19930 [Planctomycetes bacterium]|nr:hypothetical protein [Planctomycetota bacterium]